MHPVLFDFFGTLGLPSLFKLHVYGLMIAIAFLVGMNLGVRDAKRIDLSKGRRFDQFILDLCFYILIASMVGARLLFIIVNWGDDYAKDPLKIFRFWEGGLVFYGGLIGAVLYSIYYSKKMGHSFLLVADTLIPMVALGQFFGRLGCFAAGCCWGQIVPDDFALGVQFPSESLAFGSMQRVGQVAMDAAHTPHLHPVQLYESMGTLTIFFLIQLSRPWKRFNGQQLLIYMFLYPILRSSLEMLRGDKERGLVPVFGDFAISTSQIISIGVAVAAVSLLLGLLLTRPKPGADQSS